MHHLEEVQTIAIRLVAGRLDPIPAINQQIEDFAKEMLSVVNNDRLMETAHTDGCNDEVTKI